MGTARHPGLKVVGVMAMTAASIALSAAVAAANPPHPIEAYVSLYQSGTLPTLVPAVGDADLQLSFAVGGAPVWSGTLTVNAPTGTEFDTASFNPATTPGPWPGQGPSPANPMTASCAVQTPTEYECTYTGNFEYYHVAHFPLRTTDPSSTPSGGSATFTTQWGDTSPSSAISLKVAGVPVEAAPMISGQVGAVAIPLTALGVAAFRRRRRATS